MMLLVPGTRGSSGSFPEGAPLSPLLLSMDGGAECHSAWDQAFRAVIDRREKGKKTTRKKNNKRF